MMVLVFEVDPPFLLKPSFFSSAVMTRVAWGWFGLSLLKVSLPEFSTHEYTWMMN